MAAERAGEIARLKANDPELKEVRWIRAGVGNEEVARLAEGLDGNTVLQTVRLGGNAKLTDVDRLIAAVGRSGVVYVLLHATGVGAEKVREMDAVCATNEERREAAEQAGVSLGAYLGMDAVEEEEEPEDAPVEQAAAEEAPELNQWLEACGLGKYVAVMVANHITFDTLPQLDDATLSMVGLTADEMAVFRQVRLRVAVCLG